jgi:hypothetical protein
MMHQEAVLLHSALGIRDDVISVENTLTTEDLREAISKIGEGVDYFSNHNPFNARCAKAEREMGDVSCYKEILQAKM